LLSLVSTIRSNRTDNYRKSFFSVAYEKKKYSKSKINNSFLPFSPETKHERSENFAVPNWNLCQDLNLACLGKGSKVLPQH
jgi:hypothetical protein